MKKKERDIMFNDRPPMRKSSLAYVVLLIKESGIVFCTSGGEYREDLYELLYQSDSFDEAQDYYMKLRYDKK